MAQERRKPGPKKGRTWDKEWRPPAGPVLPGEFRPAAPTPAASDPGDPPRLSEGDAIRCLIRYHRWLWTGKDSLRRFNPHGRDVRNELRGQTDA